MNCEQLNAGRLRDAGDAQRIALPRMRTGTDLQRDRNVDGAHHGVENSPDAALVGKQCGAGKDVAYLLGGTSYNFV